MVRSVEEIFERHQMSDKIFQLGDLAQLPTQWNSERGLVYELYTDLDDDTKKGISIITESGRDLGGFSYAEQQTFLELIKSTNFEYDFQNVIQLDRDFNSEIFKEAFV
jgi:hypothetical protein